MADLSALQDTPTQDEAIDTTSLPEQGGGSFLVILPQTLSVRLPSNIMQAWEIIDDPVFLDAERKTPAMDPVTGKQMTIQRIKWKFDKDAPLVIVAPGNAELNEQPLPSVTITNIPRMRSKKPGVPKVSDAQYLLHEALADSVPPVSPKAWVEALGRHAGEVIRIQTGLSAYCNTEKVRYIGVPQLNAQQQVIGYDSVEDPSGTKGCGKRYYTPDFQVKGAPGGYMDRRFCAAGAGGPKDRKEQGCGAYLRGFLTVERFLRRQG